MKNSNDSIARTDENDIIELGVASTVTLGGGGIEVEPEGLFTATGISED